MSDCIFCKIARGEVPCYKILEDKNFLAFLDIEPFTKGHTLVIPKIHFRWVYDLPNFGEYWEFTKKVTEFLEPSLKPNFFTYLTMGNEVPHAHIHIIPRYPQDNLTGIYQNRRLHISDQELKIIANKIKK